jgi:hypothetical protein
MKIKSIFVAVLLGLSFVAVPAQGSDIPELGVFEFSPQEIDLTGASTDVSIRVSFVHPNGIENSKVTAQLSDQFQNTFLVDLTRYSSSTLNGSTEVFFKGTISVPRTSKSGIYKIKVLSVQSESPGGNSRIVKNIYPKDFRTLKGAENALLVRDNGYLDYDFETYFGPNYDPTKSFNFTDLRYYDISNSPIWKVGESYDPTNYFEMQDKSLVLQIKSVTPATCKVSNGKLEFVQIGSCSFTVSTPRTKDYLYKETNLSATISEARLPVELTLEKLQNLTESSIGKTITLPSVYSVVERNVQPMSSTLSVCSAAGYLLRITAGGICSLNYQTAGTATHLPSKVYTQTFEIIDSNKPVVVPTPVTTPTPTAKPVVKKTITCIKGKKTIKKTAVSPKCPAGYKLKK